MEYQEMEMKWKLETETGNRKQQCKCNLLAVVIQMLLVFAPRHPSGLPSSSFCVRCPSCSAMCDCLVFLTWVIVYVPNSILSLAFHT